MEENLKRVNKFLSESGFCSRREADRLIEAGRVKINGKVPEMGTKVAPNDVVTVDDKWISEPQEDFVYLVLNKPKGIEMLLSWSNYIKEHCTGVIDTEGLIPENKLQLSI